MKIKTLLMLLAAIAMSFTPAIAADDHTPLEKQMSVINKNLRMLKRGLSDPAKKQDNLELLQKINEAVAEASKLEPKYVAGKPNKAELMTKYKEQMDALAKTFSNLETAVKNDKADEAKAIFEKLSEQKDKGHTDFEVD